MQQLLWLAMLLVQQVPLHVAAWNTMPRSSRLTGGSYYVPEAWRQTSTVLCDTPFFCKRSVLRGEVGTCTVCLSNLGLPASPYYGADKFTEVSPYDTVHLPPVGASLDSKEDDKKEDPGTSSSSADGNASPPSQQAEQKGSKESTHTTCPPRKEDEFELPCCKPSIDVLTGGLTVRDDVSLLETQAIRGRRHQFVGAATQGLSLVLPCCGTGPSCCRWCPENLCDALERSSRFIPELWEAVCKDVDTDETQRLSAGALIASSLLGSTLK